jgi:hypothetical protein
VTVELTAATLRAMSDEDFAKVLAMVDAEDYRRHQKLTRGVTPGWVKIEIIESSSEDMGPKVPKGYKITRHHE